MKKTIKGYVSSDGSVKDYVVEEIGKEGYLKLCKASIEVIEDVLEKNEGLEEDEIRALKELQESYQRTIKGEQPERKITFEEGARYLRHCKIISIREIQPAIKKKKEYRNNVTRYKDIWRQKLPIKCYVGQFKLKEGKYAEMY